MKKNWNSIYSLSVAAVGFSLFFGFAFPKPWSVLVFLACVGFAIYANSKCRKTREEE